MKVNFFDTPKKCFGASFKDIKVLEILIHEEIN
jgi:hypothetical protein